HGELVSAQPGRGARRLESPPEVRAWFNLPLVVPGSGLSVVDQEGQRVDDRQQWRVDGDQRSLLVRMSQLAPGTYTVTWRVTAETDLDYAQGSYAFEVLPARAGWPGREGVLAVGLALLVYGALRSARPPDV